MTTRPVDFGGDSTEKDQMPRWTVAKHSPMPLQLRQLLQAMGPDTRPPLLYSGDCTRSLGHLRYDLHAHHAALSHALGESHTTLPSLTALLPSATSAHPIEMHALQEDPGATPLSHLASMIQPHAGTSSFAGSLGRIQGDARASDSFLRLRPALESLQGTQRAFSKVAGVRVSDLTPPHKPYDPASQFMSESSAFVWPPVGSTFTGQRSKLIPTNSQLPNPIDALSDLQYRRRKVATFEELSSDAPSGPAVRRWEHLSRAQDQLNLFLADYVKGSHKPVDLGLNSSYQTSHANTRIALHQVQDTLTRFANSTTSQTTV